jgi:hypothetical protein
MATRRSAEAAAVIAAVAFLAASLAGCGSSSATKTASSTAQSCAAPVAATHSAGATTYSASYDSPAGPNLYQFTFALGHDPRRAGTAVTPSRSVSFLVFDRGPVPNGFGSKGCSGALTARVFYPLPAGASAPDDALVVRTSSGRKLLALDYEFRNLEHGKILPAQAQRYLTLTSAPAGLHSATAADAKQLAHTLAGYPTAIAVATGVEDHAYPLDGSSVCDVKWPGGQSMKLAVGWNGQGNLYDVSTPQCQYLAHQVGARGTSNSTYPPQPAATQTR